MPIHFPYLPDELYARDLKRGALALRDFFLFINLFMLIYAVRKSTHPTHRAASFKTSAHTGEFEVTKMITSVRTGKIVHWICNYFELLIFFKTSAELVCTLVN